MKKIIVLMALLAPAISWAGGAIVAGGFDDRGIEISFISPGDGIDLSTEQKLFKIIKTQLKDGRIVKVTSSLRGFEGEITYCLEFQSSGLMSEAFMAIDDLVSKGKFVSGKTVPSCQ